MKDLTTSEQVARYNDRAESLDRLWRQGSLLDFGDRPNWRQDLADGDILYIVQNRDGLWEVWYSRVPGFGPDMAIGRGLWSFQAAARLADDFYKELSDLFRRWTA